ncbi:MAG: hypothetical protein ABL918_04480 [Chakrabartia sp.]
MNSTKTFSGASYGDAGQKHATLVDAKSYRRPRGTFMYEFLIWACRKS